jgi:cell division initiation protein
MAISPVELRHERPPLRLLGYKRSEVEQILGEATEAFESVWRERADLDDRVHALETELERRRETEDSIRDALVSAEKAADERRAAAGREAEQVVRDATLKAREIVSEAYAERERVRREVARLKGEEAEFRLRLRSLLGATLQGLRDHEEQLVAARVDERDAPTELHPALPD